MGGCIGQYCHHLDDVGNAFQFRGRTKMAILSLYFIAVSTPKKQYLHYYRSIVFIEGDSVDTKNARCRIRILLLKGPQLIGK